MEGGLDLEFDCQSRCFGTTAAVETGWDLWQVLLGNMG